MKWLQRLSTVLLFVFGGDHMQRIAPLDRLSLVAGLIVIAFVLTRWG